MPNRDDALEIQLVLVRQCFDEISRMGDIMKRAGPAAAGITKSSVFNVPSSDARIGQSGRERSHVIHGDIPLVVFAQLCDKAASVDHNGNWVRARSRRHAQLAELKWIGSVVEALSTRWDMGHRQFAGASGFQKFDD